MNRTIWKFPVGTLSIIEVPATARPVLVALDPATGGPAIWLELDPDAPRVERLFGIYATGQPIKGVEGHPAPIHIASVVQGAYVCHVYELRS